MHAWEGKLQVEVSLLPRRRRCPLPRTHRVPVPLPVGDEAQGVSGERVARKFDFFISLSLPFNCRTPANDSLAPLCLPSHQSSFAVFLVCCCRHHHHKRGKVGDWEAEREAGNATEESERAEERETTTKSRKHHLPHSLRRERERERERERRASLSLAGVAVVLS